MGAFVIREATSADVPALARLHVRTFNETHQRSGHGGPSYETRRWQYDEKFASTAGSWFCYVVERVGGELVGFAIGEPADFPGFEGRLNKLYLLRDCQRLGLGRRIVLAVVRRFLEQGVTSMMLFSEADNPSIRFFDALGGEQLVSDEGEFGGAYGWRDLRRSPV